MISWESCSRSCLTSTVFGLYLLGDGFGSGTLWHKLKAMAGRSRIFCICRSCDHVYCHSTLVCLSASLKGIQERSQSGKRVCFCPYLRNHGRPHGARILNRCFQRWPPPVLAGLDSRKIGMPGLNCRMVTRASLIAAVVALKDTTRLLLYVNGP